MKNTTLLCLLILALMAALLGSGPAFAQTADSGKINLNKATAAQLSKIPGITAGLAKAIVEYRQKNGPFKKPEDVAKVPGMTKEIMKKAGVQADSKGEVCVPAPKVGEDDEEAPSLKPSKC